MAPSNYHGLYELVDGKHGRREADGEVKVYRVGDKIELTEDHARSLGSRVKPIELYNEPDGDEETIHHQEGGVTWEEFLAGNNATDAISEIEQIDDLDELKAANDAETSGKDRKTVIDAIEKRLEEISSGDDEG